MIQKNAKILRKFFTALVGLIFFVPVTFVADAIAAGVETASAQTSGSNIAAATVGNLTATPNPYNSTNGFLSLSFSLSNSSGDVSITASVYSQESTKPPLKTWTLDNQSNGNKTFTWDGNDAQGNKAPVGLYLFHVGGSEGSALLISKQLSFDVASLIPADNCAGFSDVSAQDADCPAITYVKSTGAMTGTTDGKFAARDLLQRDQIIKVVLTTFMKFDATTDYCTGANPFKDLSSSDWSYQYICQAKKLGIATGYLSGPDAGYYRPSRPVNRIEFLALVLRNFTAAMPANTEASYTDVPLNQWYTGYAKYAYSNNLFNKPNLFPTSFMLRVEVARVLFKLHQLGKI